MPRRSQPPPATPATRPALLTAVPQAQRAAALDRFAVLRPHLEDGVPLTRTARDAGVALRTAQRWLARYRADGLAGPARQPRSDQGQRRLPDTLVSFIEGVALRRPATTIATVHRLAATFAAGEGWPVPSYGRVYDIIRQLDPGGLA
jgi:putative transposase